MENVLEADVMNEKRISRLESDVAHLQRDVADIKIDIREIRKDYGSLKAEIASLRDEMHTGFAMLHKEMLSGSLSNRIWMFTFAGGLLAVMAHGFKWI